MHDVAQNGFRQNSFANVFLQQKTLKKCWTRAKT